MPNAPCRCLHCGLPAKGSQYCCFGCELAAGAQEGALKNHSDIRGRIVAASLIGMTVMMFSLFLYAEDVYGADALGPLAWLRNAYRWTSLGLSLGVIFLLGGPIYHHARRSIRRRNMTMETLVALAAVAAMVLSVAELLRGGRATYFDSVVAALILVTVGRYLESVARRKTSSIAAARLAGDGGRVVALSSGESLAANELDIGHVVVVGAEGIVPTDGLALNDAEVSVAVLTGESEPQVIKSGDTVVAGAQVLRGPLEIKVTRSASESTLAQLEGLSRRLLERRPSYQRLADRLATGLVYVVTAIALGAFAYWTSTRSLAFASNVALGVLLVACPCTFGVIIPLASWLAMRNLLRDGVCLRDAEVLEKLSTVERVVFDKTGTLTHVDHRARLAYTPVDAHERDRVVAGLKALLSKIAQNSPHPHATALRAWSAGASNHGPQAGGSVVRPVAVEVLPGRGLCCLLPALPAVLSENDAEEATVRLGSIAWLRSTGVMLADCEESLASITGTAVGLSSNARLLAVFDLQESVREGASEVVAELKALGLEVEMWSGDSMLRAAAVGESLSIRSVGSLSPQQKVEALGLGSKRSPATLFVGDGINDGPVLAAAHVGMSMDNASHVSFGVADARLLGDSLLGVKEAIAMSRRAVRVARQTLVFSCLYNACFVALAASGIMRPVWAGVSMIGASFLALVSVARLVDRGSADASRTPGASLTSEYKAEAMA